jgi:ubiquinone/menaquinone biosynthesis C-methylase UbiE
MRSDLGSDYEVLGCPTCHAHLDVAEAYARCRDCGTEYSIEDGVLCTDRTDTFMGEFDPAQMRQFAEAARERGWKIAAKELMAGKDSAGLSILLSPKRAGFIDVLKPPKNDTILDLGAGMGAISLQLSKSFSQVYALDLAFERLAFLQVVAEQEGTTGIRTICHRDVCNLPFQSDMLDAALMMGVFEYFPLSYPKETVRDVQLKALTELHRVISPGGTLFIGTKNRFGWPYWAGATDNSGLRFGSVLPRRLADIASRALLRHPYRTVTDSYQGYTSLLEEAGFEDLRFYWPVNGYQESLSWIDLSDKAAVQAEINKYPANSLKRAALSTFSACGLFSRVVPHFGITAKKAA